MHILFSFVCMCMQVHMYICMNEGTHTHSMCVDVRGQFGCQLSPPTLFETALMLSSQRHADCLVSHYLIKKESLSHCLPLTYMKAKTAQKTGLELDPVSSDVRQVSHGLQSLEVIMPPLRQSLLWPEATVKHRSHLGWKELATPHPMACCSRADEQDAAVRATMLHSCVCVFFGGPDKQVFLQFIDTQEL